MLNNNSDHSRQKTIAGMLNEYRIQDYREPEKYLGPFDALPLEVQHAMVKSIANEDRWIMIGHETGSWRVKFTRLFIELGRKFSNSNHKYLGRIARLFSNLFQNGPANVIHKSYRILNDIKCRLSGNRSLQAVVSNTVSVPRNFSVCYARNIPQLASYRGFWNDQSRHNTYGVLTGIDLLPSSKGYWFIENNMNFGMSPGRTRLYETDPFVSNLVRFTADNGYHNLVFINNRGQNLNDRTAKQLTDEALSNNIKLTIIEDAYLPYSKYERRFGVPSLNNDNTLVARAKYYRTNLDYLFQNKRGSCRALSIYKMHHSEPGLLVPGSEEDPFLETIDEDAPFPNLVYKLPGRYAGSGIIFIKAHSTDHARKLVAEAMMKMNQKEVLYIIRAMFEDRKGIYQSYIRSPMLAGRKLFKVRAHVLITPVGLQFLAAHRVISRFSVPDTLPFGIVADPSPYLVNLSSSSHYEIIPPEEEQSVKEAALSVARGLSWAAKYGFQTGS